VRLDPSERAISVRPERACGRAVSLLKALRRRRAAQRDRARTSTATDIMKRSIVVAHVSVPKRSPAAAVLEGARHPTSQRCGDDRHGAESSGRTLFCRPSVILGRPRNLGYLSRALTDFFDRPSTRLALPRGSLGAFTSAPDVTAPARERGRELAPGLRCARRLVCAGALHCRGDWRESVCPTLSRVGAPYGTEP